MIFLIKVWKFLSKFFKKNNIIFFKKKLYYVSVSGWMLLGLGVIQLPIWMIVNKLKQSEGKSCLDVSIKKVELEK